MGQVVRRQWGVKFGAYQLRHGDPSHDIAARKRTHQEAQEWGRCMMESYVRRYQTSGCPVERLHLVKPDLRPFGGKIFNTLHEYYWERRPLPPLSHPGKSTAT